MFMDNVYRVVLFSVFKDNGSFDVTLHWRPHVTREG